MGTAPLRPCVVCGVACKTGRCEKHARPSKSRRYYEVSIGRKRDKRFYKRRRWHRTRGAKLNAQPLCEECKKRGLVVPATEVHHMVERKADPARAYDLGNLQSLCKACHARISNIERGMDARDGQCQAV